MNEARHRKTFQLEYKYNACDSKIRALIFFSTINGTWNIPRMKCMDINGSAIVIHENAKINPMEVDDSENIINYNESSGDNRFYSTSGGNIVHGGAEVNWCRFVVNEIAIDYSFNGKIRTNSIFIPRTHFKISGTAS